MDGMPGGFQDVSCRRSEEEVEVEVEAQRRNIPVVALAGAELAEKRHIIFRSFALQSSIKRL